ncbi:MAG: FixH family protein [Elusimicrobiota bacterium]|nr:MAG: FixH family protein [Elusimicrobiota bacterium]
MIRPALVVIVACAMTAGCAAVEPVFQRQENPWDSPQSRWVLHQDGFRVDFALKPMAPDETQPAELEISITDLSADPPRPVAGARVKGTARMPRKPGHIHVLDLLVLHKEVAAGAYGMHLTFGMGGEWLAEFDISLPDGKVLKASFPFVISGSEQAPWERKGRK